MVIRFPDCKNTLYMAYKVPYRKFGSSPIATVRYLFCLTRVKLPKFSLLYRGPSLVGKSEPTGLKKNQGLLQGTDRGVIIVLCYVRDATNNLVGNKFDGAHSAVASLGLKQSTKNVTLKSLRRMQESIVELRMAVIDLSPTLLNIVSKSVLDVVKTRAYRLPTLSLCGLGGGING